MSAWEEAVAKVLADPAASYWLKEALERALARDPVDAATDAAILATILKARADYLLGKK